MNLLLILLALDALSVSAPRCEYRDNPLGIDVAQPRLSWILESPGRGVMQTTYRIRVARTQAGLDTPDLWDSGEVASDQSTHVVYQGAALGSGERAYWKVTVKDNRGNVAESAPAWWEMGLLRREDWQAEWIGIRTADPVPPLQVSSDLRWIWSPNPAQTCVFRRAFTLPDKDICHAFLMVTADDRFEVTINGEEAGRGFSWRQLYVLDVAEWLVPGANEIAITAINVAPNAGVIAQLNVTFESGESFVLPTDKSWQEAREVCAYGQGVWAALANKSVPAFLAPPSPHLRKTFSLDGPVRRARVYATALGVYELCINGRRVGADHLAPGWTDYAKRIEYQTYDVTEMLREGENVVGAILGDGWYAGRVGWLQTRENHGPYPLRLLLQLEIELENGRRTVVSDGSWKGSAGPIMKSDLLDGETYDARRELDAPGKAVETFPDARGRAIEASCSDGVRVTQILKPVRRTQPRPGAYVFDMGQNMVGWARLKVRGPAGRRVTLRFAEALNPDGTLYRTNLRSARVVDRYILKGGTEETWEPRFTFHGFRYVEVTGYPGVPDLDDVAGCVAHSAMDPTGTFECSSEMVNRLQSNIVWGQRGNMLSVPTDCPQRDERLGWMGDMQIFLRTACFNMDVAPFITRWMKEVALAQSPNGAFSLVAPRIVQPADTLTGSSEAGIIVPWVIWQHYGDRRILEEHYEGMKKWVDYLHGLNPELLWLHKRGYDLGDWLNVNSETPKDLYATSYYALAADLTARTAEVLGKDDDREKYRKLFEGIRAAFVKAFVAKDGRLKGDTQTGYALALEFGLVPEELRPAAGDHLAKACGHITSGFMGVEHLLPALTATGHTDAAYRLLLNDAFPSWGFQIKHGATTIWERWDGWTPEKGFQNSSMNSFNHFAFGSVGKWMYAVVAGIGLDAPGYKRIVIRPRPDGGLTHAGGELRSMYGRIASHWKREGTRFSLEVVIPANTTATVYVPASGEVTEAGKPAGASEGVEFLRREDGCAVFSVGSGRYLFGSTDPGGIR